MNFVTNFLTLQNQLRVYHWQTQKKPGSYAQHIAFGTAYEELEPLIDDFIEIYQGKKGALLAKGNFTIICHNLKDDYVDFIDENGNLLIAFDPSEEISTMGKPAFGFRTLLKQWGIRCHDMLIHDPIKNNFDLFFNNLEYFTQFFKLPTSTRTA